MRALAQEGHVKNSEIIYGAAHRFLKQYRSRVERQLGSYGLSIVEVRVLTAVYTSSESMVTQESLAAALSIDRSNIGRAAKKLEQKGFITRAADQEDARVSLVVLTDEGRALEPEVTAVSDQLLSSMAMKLTERELETLTLLLAKATSTLG